MSAAPAGAPHRGYKRSQPAPLKVVPPRIRFAHKRQSYAEMVSGIRESKWAPQASIPTRVLPDFFRVTGGGCTGGIMAMIAHHTFAQPHGLDKPWTAPEWTEPTSDEEWAKLAGDYSRDQGHDSIAYALEIGMLQRRSEVDAETPKEAYFQYRWTPGLVWKDLPSAFTPRVEKKPPASETEGEEKATLSGIAIPLAFDKSFRINKAVEASWPETIGSGIAAKLKRPPQSLTVTASDPDAQVSTLQVARTLYVHVILPAPGAPISPDLGPATHASEELPTAVVSGVSFSSVPQSQPAAATCHGAPQALQSPRPEGDNSSPGGIACPPSREQPAGAKPGVRVVSSDTGKVVGQIAAFDEPPNHPALPFSADAFVNRMAELGCPCDDAMLATIRSGKKCEDGFFLERLDTKIGTMPRGAKFGMANMPRFIRETNEAWRNGGKAAWAKRAAGGTAPSAEESYTERRARKLKEGAGG
jgi:hypothetical protein